jgi:methionine aminopeptidase
MTQDEIIEMARQAGMVYREFEDEFANANTDGVDLKTIQAFTKLVTAKEREACAKVCDNNQYVHPYHDLGTLIRARGEA